MGKTCRVERFVLNNTTSSPQDWLSIVGAWSAIGTLIISQFTLLIAALTFLRGTSRTKVLIREHLIYPWGLPFLLGRKSLEQDLRIGIMRQSEEGEAVHREDFFVALSVRVNRSGASALNVEYVELFDTKRKEPITRAKGANNETVRTIEAHDHYEWRFFFDEVWKHLAFHYRETEYPRVRVRVITGDGTPLRGQRLSISGARLLEMALVSQKVFGELPSRG